MNCVSLYTLPVEQYPDIAPPQINISATYTGASAQTVENSVTQIIEQQLTGLEGMIYFSSSSSSSGNSKISVTFEQGIDPDIAQVQVQNKIEQILSRLPDDVQRQGLRVVKSQSDFLLLASLYDETEKAEKADIADYLISNLQDSISRIEGVGPMQYGTKGLLGPNFTDIEEKYDLTEAQDGFGEEGEEGLASDDDSEEESEDCDSCGCGHKHQ